MWRSRWLVPAVLCAAFGVPSCTSHDDGPVTAAETAPSTAAEPPSGTGDDGIVEPDDPGSSGGSAPDAATLDFSEVGEVVDGFVGSAGLNGAGVVVVDRDAGTVYEHYAGEFDRDRISLVASSSKMVSAGILMHLHERDVLDVDAPVAEVVEWGASNPGVTPAQLLSNSSGLVGLIGPGNSPLFVPYLCQFIPVGTLEDCGRSIFTTSEDDEFVVPPDTEFRYGGGQWQVAGAVAEAASGRSWSELVDEVYVTPCGLRDLGYGNHFAESLAGGDPFSYPSSFAADPANLTVTANPNIEGGLWATPTDYATLLHMYLQGGRCGTQQVLTEASIERLTSDRIGAVYGGDTDQELLGYGLGWWVDRDTGRVEDGGAYGATPWLDLDRGYGVHLVIEDRSDVGRQLADMVRPIIEERFDSLGRG